MDLNLNLGGFLGAAIGGGTPLAVAITTGVYEGMPISLVVPGVVAGALAGNYLWGMATAKPPEMRKNDKKPKE